MSLKAEDKIPEFQSSFVQTFLKQKLGKDVLISSNFRKEYSKCLSLFLFYLATIMLNNDIELFSFHFRAKHNSGEKKKITREQVSKALSDIGFEEFADQLSGNRFDQTKEIYKREIN